MGSGKNQDKICAVQSKTTRKTLAAEDEKRRRRELEQHISTGVRPTDPKRMLRTVRQAVLEYQTSYDAPTHRPKSIAWVKERCPHLVRLLGNLRLLDIDDERVLGYMRGRDDEGASNRTINMELDCLARAAGRKWKELWPTVAKLEEEQT